MKKLLILLTLLFPLSLAAEETEIPGEIIGAVQYTFNSGLKVQWLNNHPKRPKHNSILSIEWGDGQYFTTVVASRKKTILVDYTPSSTVVPEGAWVRLYSGSIKKNH